MLPRRSQQSAPTGGRRIQKVEQPTPTVHYTLEPKSYSGPRAEEILAKRQRHLSAGQYHFYEDPLMLVEASMQYCFDDKGNQYVDAYSNVCHVGHCHPHFVRSCQTALTDIISNTRYLHPTIVRYAEKLKATLPSSLSVCYFVNSGSEANDLAMRLARVHTGRKTVVCLEHAYHGTTLACTGVSTSLSTGTTKNAADYKYCARDIAVAPVPDPYRGEFKGVDPDSGRKYAQQLKRTIQQSTEDGKIAAFIHESVQGVGGQIVYPHDYLQRAYKAVHEAGGVCIADEVQTGFGRSGTHFWAFEVQNVVPDIVVMGKPIGNGFPLGAVVCTKEVAQSFDGVQYFNTNGGNPVACAAGLAVLEIIERDRLQEKALHVSQHLMSGLIKLKSKHEIIGDVRGVGLFVGIELVRDRQTLEPAVEETKMTMEKCRQQGLLVGKGGSRGNVIRLKPPLCFTTEDADFLIRVFDVVLGEIARTSRHRLVQRSQAHPNPPTAFGDVPESYVLGGATPKHHQSHHRRRQSFHEEAETTNTNTHEHTTVDTRHRPSVRLLAADTTSVASPVPNNRLTGLVEASLAHSGSSVGRKRRSLTPPSRLDEEEEDSYASTKRSRTEQVRRRSFRNNNNSNAFSDGDEEEALDSRFNVSSSYSAQKKHYDSDEDDNDDRCISRLVKGAQRDNFRLQL